MKINHFKIEEWMNEYEDDAVYNLAETCVDSLTLRELVELGGSSYDTFFQNLADYKLTYGHIEGSEEFKTLVSGLYENQTPDNVLAMNGAIGANFLVLYSLIEAGDEVVSVHPTYQQLYDVPESFGATVKKLYLRPENHYLPDIKELENMVSNKTKLIIINNPNNPSGAVMDRDYLKKIVAVAESVDAYILCDEVYRNLLQNTERDVPSIVDLYDKGISTSSMSKVLSLAGLRLGWIAANEAVIKECIKHRDYTTISCGMMDDILAVHALKHYDLIMERNLKIIHDNLNILDQWIEREPKIHYVKPEAGTTAVVHFDYDLSSVDFCKGLYDLNGAFLAPGSAFDLEGTFRIGYACGTQVLKDGLEKVSEYLRTIEPTEEIK
ncbi:aminotransferase [Corticicoccus populi]|uniref:Aminotransferase n=1 Tax=Corticicoccus populi TaxID=1812821 RepID=A0ABW5WQT2_9STAP